LASDTRAVRGRPGYSIMTVKEKPMGKGGEESKDLWMRDGVCFVPMGGKGEGQLSVEKASACCREKS